ncbi:MAG TPA: helix-turn-helix transcriptional regulator [Longimicrobium sp.]|nr:helix-turn-helix transcriptional regulator [Longimicrobium sp.]
MPQISEPVIAAPLALAERLDDAGFWMEVQRITQAVLDGEVPSGSRSYEVTAGARRFPTCVAQIPSAAAPIAVVVVVETDGAALPDGQELRRRFGLTEREAEVALLLAERRSNAEIARELAVTRSTVSRHTEKIFRKLGISSRRDVRGVLARAPGGGGEAADAP